MAITDLFSKRQRRLKGLVPDVYQYEELPQELRVQIVQIINETIGDEINGYDSYTIYSEIHNTLCKEYGVFELKKNSKSNYLAVYNYFLEEDDYEKCLDIIELSFQWINGCVRNNPYRFRDIPGVKQAPDDAIQELNLRFKERGVGYQFEFKSNVLIKIDSQYLHSEVVKPVLHLLGSDNKYSGANDEFLTAHEHYRHKRYKECLNDCLKSFESLMKAIHEKHSWSYKKTDTAKTLINSCFANKLIPEYLQNQFSSIRTLLESGIPTVRNKEGGHGQGSEITTVSEHLASYTLHLTATNLLFLAKCEEEHR